MRDGGEAARLSVPPGRKVTAPLQLARASVYPECDVKQAAGFRIYLPDDTSAQFTPSDQQGCTNTDIELMQIQPFR
jgi:Protein of unknown function (DUF4232)